MSHKILWKTEKQRAGRDRASGKLFISTSGMEFRVFPRPSPIFCTETDTLAFFCACIFKSDGKVEGNR